MLDFGSIGEYALAEFSPQGAPIALVDTDVLQLPINCILAGQQVFKDSYREKEITFQPVRTVISVSGAEARRIKGPPPSFTVKKGTF